MGVDGEVAEHRHVSGLVQQAPLQSLVRRPAALCGVGPAVGDVAEQALHDQRVAAVDDAFRSEDLPGQRPARRQGQRGGHAHRHHY